jgi:hypothetical protein
MSRLFAIAALALVLAAGTAALMTLQVQPAMACTSPGC